MSETTINSAATPKHFLSHIEGLRGLAILFVVLYHLNPEWCRHGYYGVDVFFVISGYLIYKGYLSKENNYPGFFSFCGSRITRLFPSLIIMLGAYHLLSIVLLDPREWAHGCISAVAGMLGYANYYFKQELEDYFAADAARYPLLHLWYLSVIIHFYLLFAFFFIILKKISIRWRWTFLIALAVFSFYFCFCSKQLYTLVQGVTNIPLGKPPVNTYYWSLARFWECILGMLIVYLPQLKSDTLKTILFILGIACIAIPSFITIPGETQNISAVAGAMMVIAYNPRGYAAGILSNGPLMFLGKISFSLYLWHHIIFYIWKHYTYWHLTPWHQSLYMLGCAIIISWAAWKLIEKRRFSFAATIVAWGALLALTLCVTGSSRIPLKILISRPYVHCNESEPYKYRLKSSRGTPFERFNTEARFKPWLVPRHLANERVGIVGNETMQPSFAIIGDSHAHACVAGMDIIAREAGVSGLLLLTRGIPFCTANYSLDKPVEEQNNFELVLSYLINQPDLKTVVSVCLWGDVFSSDKPYQQAPEAAIRQFCEELTKAGKKVILITDNPKVAEPRLPWYVTFCQINGITPNAEAVSCTEEAYFQYNKRALAAMNQLEQDGLCKVIHLEHHLFKNGCFHVLTEDNSLLMYDTNHLMILGAMRLFEKIKPDMVPLLRDIPDAARTGD